MIRRSAFRYLWRRGTSGGNARSGVRRSRHSAQVLMNTAVPANSTSFRFRIGINCHPLIDQRGTKLARQPTLSIAFLDQRSCLVFAPASSPPTLDDAPARDISVRAILCTRHSSNYNATRSFSPPNSNCVPSRAMPHDQARDS